MDKETKRMTLLVEYTPMPTMGLAEDHLDPGFALTERGTEVQDRTLPMVSVELSCPISEWELGDIMQVSAYDPEAYKILHQKELIDLREEVHGSPPLSEAGATSDESVIDEVILSRGLTQLKSRLKNPDWERENEEAKLRKFSKRLKADGRRASESVSVEGTCS